MANKFIRMIFLIAAISASSYLVSIFLKYYNSQENVEKRCNIKFQKEFKKVEGKSDDEWGVNIDIANENYFKCMKIP